MEKLCQTSKDNKEKSSRNWKFRNMWGRNQTSNDEMVPAMRNGTNFFTIIKLSGVLKIMADNKIIMIRLTLSYCSSFIISYLLSYFTFLRWKWRFKKFWLMKFQLLVLKWSQILQFTPRSLNWDLKNILDMLRNSHRAIESNFD